MNYYKRPCVSETQDQPVEEEKSSDDVPMDNGDNSVPVLIPQDGSAQENNNQIQQNQIPDGSDQSVSDDDNDDDDDDDGENFPQCYPQDPPLVEHLPRIEYPADAVRSSPSARNREFNRRLQENFVPYSKGMRGEIYRKRTAYEHQSVMG